MNKHIATLLAQHFDIAFASLEGVTRLRELILTLAMQGKLVEQDPKDQPASELLKEIEAKKKRLIAEKKIRKQKPLLPVNEEEMPYELPESWEWVRFGQLNPQYQNGISKRSSSHGNRTIVVRLADIIDNKISLDDTRSIQLTDNERSKYVLNDGDVLITRVNGSIDLVGSFILAKKIQTNIAYCDHFIRARLPLKFVDFEFIHKTANSPFIRKQIENKFITTAGQKTVNQTHISTLIFPLPPLAEQHRIVTKINQLMNLCDQLDQQITARNEKQTELLNAVMDQV